MLICRGDALIPLSSFPLSSPAVDRGMKYTLKHTKTSLLVDELWGTPALLHAVSPRCRNCEPVKWYLVVLGLLL
jgi:hypothetical protein